MGQYALADEQGHHPDVHLTSCRELELVLYTHAIDGSSINDSCWRGRSTR